MREEKNKWKGWGLSSPVRNGITLFTEGKKTAIRKAPRQEKIRA
jgi:hypothetical protein